MRGPARRRIHRMRGTTRPRWGRTRYSPGSITTAHTSISWCAPRLRIVDATWRWMPPAPPKNFVERRILTARRLRAGAGSPLEHEQPDAAEGVLDAVAAVLE